MAINYETFKDGGLKYALLKLKAKLDALLALKYDKTGGEITGNVKIDGTLTLDIDDPDYDSGITFDKSLDTNSGTILSLNGYANGNENTNYRPVIRNVANPVNNYDVANKAYVDAQVVRPKTYLVLLANDGSIDTVTATLTYSAVKAELTNPTTSVSLDVIYQSSRFYIPAVQDRDTNNGPVIFVGHFVNPTDGSTLEAVFALDSSDHLSVVMRVPENSLLKTNDIASNATSTVYYPSAKAVYDYVELLKPVVVWETNGTGLTALETDMSANPSWQLTDLDMTPFRRIKIYTKAAQKSGTTASASTTPAFCLEMILDSRAAGPYGGHYLASNVIQKSNDRNRLATLTCAVSADKTKFAVMRMTNLYGTGATDNSDAGGYVFLIEGYRY